MSKLSATDVRLGSDYETVRDEVRRQMAELKRYRRVALGEELSMVFENRETIRAAAEEILRAEHITDPERVQMEVEAFNAVIPTSGALGATLYLEVADPADLDATASRLEGVERSVYLEVAGSRITAVVEELLLPEEAPSAFYLRFALTAEQRQAWLGGAEVCAGIEHSEFGRSTILHDDQRRAIAADL